MDQFRQSQYKSCSQDPHIPYDLPAAKPDTGSKIEVLLLKPLPCGTPGCCTWECLTRPQKRLRAETSRSLYFFKEEDDNTPLFGAHVEELLEDGIPHLTFTCDNKKLLENLDQIGTMPLPPYIHERLKDSERYQTVYNRERGSAAAPTAGLHFTEELFEKLQAKGVRVLDVTLHVGLGTFKPLKEDDVLEHKMHEEYYSMSQEVADALNQAKEEGRRIIAIGTTSCRTLESVMQKYEKFTGCSGYTDIYIYPGYTFKAIDALITNFHLPESTLILLVSALASREYILAAYNVAIKEKYRFFSFGDAMFIY